MGVLKGFHRLIELLRLKILLGRAIVIALPYGWHVVFFMIPFLIVFGISLSEGVIGSPPYKSLFSWVDESFLSVRLNLGNYMFLFEDDLYLAGYLESLKISFLATLLCLLIGYPVAYGISRASSRGRTLLLMLVILPFWTSFLIRIYAWMGILNYHGLINTLLLKMGVIQEPLHLIHNDFAVCLGIVYSYLPFMILPIYSTLEKINPELLEAAYDLGCKPRHAFLKITLPLSFQGIMAGSMLVFIPGVGEFVIPELLGGSDTLMIGKILWGEFFMNRDWPMASSLAIALLMALVIPIFIFQKLIAAQERRTQ